MADNLESYFKKHLSDDNPAQESWNVPSDNVWDKVLPEIQKKRGIFIPWKYLYLLGALIIISGIVLYWQYGTEENSNDKELTFTTDQTDKTLDNLNIQAETNNKTGNQYNELNAKPNTVSTSEKYANLKEGSVLKSQNNLRADQEIQTNNRNAETKNENNYQNTGNLKNDAQYTETSVSNKDLQTALNSEKTNTITEDKKDQLFIYADKQPFEKSEYFNEINMLSKNDIPRFTVSADYTLLERNFNTESPVTLEANHKESSPFNNKGKVGVGAYFLPTFTSTYLTGDLSTGKLETSNMYLYSSNWGIELRYYLSNRFTLVAGVGQSEVRSWSKSLVDFDYDSTNEHIMDTGEKENTSSVPMPTPFGEIGTEITYRFPGEENIPDGETMQSELETHQDVRYLTVPIGAEYNIIQFSHFNWFAETGVRYNHALKDAASFSSRILHHGHDMDVVGEEMMGHPTYKDFYFDLYLGTGINYQFSDSFQINGSARYFNSITNVNFQDNMSTQVRGFNFKIGISYLF